MNGDRDRVPPTLLDSTEDSSYSLSGKIMVSVILILFFVVVLLIALHLYVRSHLLRFRRRRLSRRRTGLNEAHVRHRRPSQIVFTTTLTDSSDPGNRGLESSVLSSLPVFLYSAKNHPEPLDCAVCLSEFEENEEGRFLPKCSHSFHTECIDMWFYSHSTCPLCRAPVEPVPEPDNTIGSSERTENEPAGTSSGLCVACQHEEGNSSTSSSLRSRRKGLDVTIDVPLRTELEDELTLSSVGGGSRSPGTRLLSARMKRLLSIGGRKTPTSVRSTTPFGVESSNRIGGEVDLEKGPSELTPR